MENLLGIPMNVVAGLLVTLFAAGVGILAASAARNRLLLAIAVRNVSRRRAQSFLITLGLALGTVIITTALNTGDTMSHTVRTLVAGTVGRADEVIVQPRRDGRRTGFDAVQSVVNGTFLTGALSPFDQDEYDRIASALEGDQRIAGLTPAIVDQAVVSNLTNHELQNQVRLLALPRDYPPVFGIMTSAGSEPIRFDAVRSGELVANVDAAAALQAQAGDRLRIHYGNHIVDLVLRAVVRAGDLTGTQPTVVVPLEDLQAQTDQVRRINQILVANRGDSTTSVRLSEQVAGVIRPLLMDETTSRRLHTTLRSDAVRAALAASLPNLEDRDRAKVEALLQELDRDDPSAEFVRLASDPDVERRVAALAARTAAPRGRLGGPGSSTTSPLRIVEIKRLSQELADRWGGALTTVFVILGLFSIATGVLLVVLIFSLIAAERRSEMGTTRALGARRAHLVLMFLYEGLIYDLVASALGLAIGVGAGLLLVAASASLLSGVGIELQPRIEPRTLLVAYCAGAVLTMLSIGYGAWRASRVTIVTAIRDLPDPPVDPHRLMALVPGPVLLTIGCALTALGLRGAGALPLGLGVVLSVLGATTAIRPWLQRAGLDEARSGRTVFTVGGLILLAYWLAPNEIMAGTGLRPLPRTMDLFFVAGLSLVLGTVWIVSHNLDLVEGLVRRLAARSAGGALVPRLALAYPAAHRFRTGLTIALFSLVIFSMVVASVLLTGTHRAYGDPSVMAGGFDIRVEQSVPTEPGIGHLLSSSESIRPSEIAVTARQLGRNAEAIQFGDGRQTWRSVGLHLLDDAFLSSVRAGFTARAPAYPDDPAVWRALRDNPGLAIVAGSAAFPAGSGPTEQNEVARGSQFRLDGVSPDETRLEPRTVWVRDGGGGRSIKLTVIGILDPRTTFGSGLFTSEATFVESGAPPPARTTYLIGVQTGVDPAEKALAIGLALADHGVRAIEIGEEVRRIHGVRALLNELLQGFIGIGLLAGIAGLGVIATRAVVERQQQIGLLRALGFRRRTVQIAFLLEASIQAGLGIAAGVMLGLGLSYRLVQYLGTRFPEILFSVPWLQIVIIAAISYGAAMITTVLPAHRAGQISPAQALRHE